MVAATMTASPRSKVGGDALDLREFKFANERAERDDEPVDLPNPLPRRVIN
jgi:hypothetical protein